MRLLPSSHCRFMACRDMLTEGIPIVYLLGDCRTSMKDLLSSKECAERLKALADEDRLRIVQVLRSGGKNVGEIAAELAAEISNISHHLQILKREGIVETEKQGRFVVYRLHPDVFAATRANSDCIDLGCCKLELPK